MKPGITVYTDGAIGRIKDKRITIRKLSDNAYVLRMLRINPERQYKNAWCKRFRKKVVVSEVLISPESLDLISQMCRAMQNKLK